MFRALRAKITDRDKWNPPQPIPSGQFLDPNVVDLLSTELSRNQAELAFLNRLLTLSGTLHSFDGLSHFARWLLSATYCDDDNTDNYTEGMLSYTHFDSMRPFYRAGFYLSPDLYNPVMLCQQLSEQFPAEVGGQDISVFIKFRYYCVSRYIYTYLPVGFTILALWCHLEAIRLSQHQQELAGEEVLQVSAYETSIHEQLLWLLFRNDMVIQLLGRPAVAYIEFLLPFLQKCTALQYLSILGQFYLDTASSQSVIRRLLSTQQTSTSREQEGGSNAGEGQNTSLPHQQLEPSHSSTSGGPPEEIDNEEMTPLTLDLSRVIANTSITSSSLPALHQVVQALQEECFKALLPLHGDWAMTQSLQDASQHNKVYEFIDINMLYIDSVRAHDEFDNKHDIATNALVALALAKQPPPAVPIATKPLRAPLQSMALGTTPHLSNTSSPSVDSAHQIPAATGVADPNGVPTQAARPMTFHPSAKKTPLSPLDTSTGGSTDLAAALSPTAASDVVILAPLSVVDNDHYVHKKTINPPVHFTGTLTDVCKFTRDPQTNQIVMRSGALSLPIDPGYWSQREQVIRPDTISYDFVPSLQHVELYNLLGVRSMAETVLGSSEHSDASSPWATSSLRSGGLKQSFPIPTPQRSPSSKHTSILLSGAKDTSVQLTGEKLRPTSISITKSHASESDNHSPVLNQSTSRGSMRGTQTTTTPYRVDTLFDSNPTPTTHVGTPTMWSASSLHQQSPRSLNVRRQTFSFHQAGQLSESHDMPRPGSAGSFASTGSLGGLHISQSFGRRSSNASRSGGAGAQQIIQTVPSHLLNRTSFTAVGAYLSDEIELSTALLSISDHPAFAATRKDAHSSENVDAVEALITENSELSRSSLSTTQPQPQHTVTNVTSPRQIENKNHDIPAASFSDDDEDNEDRYDMSPLLESGSESGSNSDYQRSRCHSDIVGQPASSQQERPPHDGGEVSTSQDQPQFISSYAYEKIYFQDNPTYAVLDFFSGETITRSLPC